MKFSFRIGDGLAGFGHSLNPADSVSSAMYAALSLYKWRFSAFSISAPVMVEAGGGDGGVCRRAFSLAS